jgi:hypothetical protein
MQSNDTVRYVASQRCHLNKLRYGVTVYVLGSRFFGSWFCEECLAHGETGIVADPDTAQRRGRDAVRQHHAQQHSRAACGELGEKMVRD